MILLNTIQSTVFWPKRFTLILFLCKFLSYTAASQTTVYLIPGQGSDERLYRDLALGDAYQIRHIRWVIPTKHMSMRSYAAYLARQIDTSEPFILIGTSLGGMLATEMSTFLEPEHTIVISSAKSRKELPHRYRFQRFLPIYDLIPPRLSKTGALLLQPIVEPDRNSHKEIFVSMLRDKPPIFLKRTIAMIINWERREVPEGIIHIHGDRDHTLPNKHISCDYLVEGGSHMMTLTRAEEISAIITEILRQGS